MRVILYGVGDGLDCVEGFLKKDHTVVGYSDVYSGLTVFHGKPYLPEKALAGADDLYDVIVTTTDHRKQTREIVDHFIQDLGIAVEKIVPFALWVSSEAWKNAAQSVPCEDVEGVILGNSHVYYDIDTSFLSRKFINLSFRMQDIYSNYVVFERYLRNYPVSVKYLWIDMWNYYWLNIDNSMGKGLFHYIKEGGVIEKHNYDKNTAMGGVTFERALWDLGRQAPPDADQKERFEELFGADCVVERMRNLVNRDAVLGEQITVEPGLMGVNLFRVEHDTIDENLAYIEKIIDLARESCPDVKLLFTLLPAYCAVERMWSYAISEWKEEFMRHMSEWEAKYHALFLNYKDLRAISGKRLLYMDPTHLNRIGARFMTSVIDRDLIEKYY